jgi:threonyl-tRNA synthetase
MSEGDAAIAAKLSDVKIEVKPDEAASKKKKGGGGKPKLTAEEKAARAAANKAANMAKGGGAKKKDDKKAAKGGGAAAIAGKEAPFVAGRLAVWDRVMKRQQAAHDTLVAAGTNIVVTLPDGKTVDCVAGVDSPLSVATGISPNLAKNVVVAKVNGVIQDLQRPFTESASLELIKFSDPDGAYTFWHSSAHILGQALEAQFGGELCVGPPLEEGGFYYDMHTGDVAITKDDYKRIESTVNTFVKEKHPFVRLEMTKKEALEMFAYNKFKVQLISAKVPDGENCTAYRCGPLIDLCRGPHVPDTGR